jgi:DNA topoisomerase-3
MNKFYRNAERIVKTKGHLTIMMVAEKPSIAKTISEVLSKDPRSNQGIHKPCPIWTFDGIFKGFKAKFKVTSVAGHMYNRDFSKEVNKNKKMDPYELFDLETFTFPSSGAMCKHIQVVSKGVDVLCLWLDCDREGENICFEVIDNVRESMPKPANDYIFRAKFSSIAPKDVITAFETLSYKPNKFESMSVDARQILDLKIGVSFSRFQSREILNLFPELSEMFDISSITYGPCQTPTLGFCVDRAEMIQKFIPERYWTINASVVLSNVSFTLKWNR